MGAAPLPNAGSVSSDKLSPVKWGLLQTRETQGVHSEPKRSARDIFCFVVLTDDQKQLGEVYLH